MKIPVELRSEIVGSLEELTMGNIWKLRSDVLILRSYVSRTRGSENELILKSINEFLDVSSDLYSFFSDICFFEILHRAYFLEWSVFYFVHNRKIYCFG